MTKRIRNLSRSGLLFFLTVGVLSAGLLSGCGGSKTMIIKPSEASLNQYRFVEVPPVANKVGAPESVVTHIREKVLEELRKVDGRVTANYGSKNQDAAAIQISVVNWDKGSRVGRWATGGIVGEGTINVLISIVDASTGQVIAQANAEGTVSAGVGGGGMDTAAENVVKGVVQFVRSQL